MQDTIPTMQEDDAMAIFLREEDVVRLLPMNEAIW